MGIYLWSFWAWGPVLSHGQQRRILLWSKLKLFDVVLHCFPTSVPAFFLSGPDMQWKNGEYNSFYVWWTSAWGAISVVATQAVQGHKSISLLHVTGLLRLVLPTIPVLFRGNSGRGTFGNSWESHPKAAGHDQQVTAKTQSNRAMLDRDNWQLWIQISYP